MRRRLAVLPVATALLALVAPPPPARAATVLERPGAAGATARVLAAERRLGARRVGTITGLGVRVLRVDGDAAVLARRLAAAPGVRWAEPDLTLRAAAVPDDPLFARTALRSLGAGAAWDALGLGAFPSGGGVRVGVVDTGIDAAHEDLRDRAVACATATDGVVRAAACADDNGHGTHVAGTIAATADNGVGLAGVAFSSPLVVCRALGTDGTGSTADAAACLRWAHDRGAKVVALGMAGAASRTLALAARYAWEGGQQGGSVLVAPAGNDGTQTTAFPAGLPEVVSAGAVDGAGAPAPFSDRNGDVELTAPGVYVASTRRGGGYASLSGTSMAAAHVAGAAALLFDAHRRAAASTIRRRLDLAVVDLGDRGRDDVFGFGRLDLARIGP
jgi:thermitase